MKFKFAKRIKVGKIWIGQGTPIFIIAEAGVNHNGNLDIAKKLVDEAKRIGADAVKFQSFTAENLVSKDTPKVEHHKNGADPKETHYDMIKKLELSQELQKKIFDYCREKEILFLSTPYDVGSARFLNELGVRAFKTASADIVDLPLHEYIASTGKPAIIATGMASYDEIEEVLNIYKRHKNPNAILLHCVSSYPASQESLNLRIILKIKERFGTIVGYSDHSVGNLAAIISASLGGSVLEKHFTLDRNAPGPDHKTSDNPEEFAALIKAIRDSETALGNGIKKMHKTEKSMHSFSRKSLVATQDIPAGVRITKDMLTLKRPGTGITYSKIKSVLGLRTRKIIGKDTLVLPKDLKK